MTAGIHPDGGYRFAPGISPYSGGVAAQPGFVIRHLTLRETVGWQEGFERVDAHLAAAGRPRSALCAIELRCPRPHPFDGFGSFNTDYRAVLESWGVLIDDVNPVARTNVAPLTDPPTETTLHAFSYTIEAESDAVVGSGDVAPSFVIAGAGDLVDQSDLRPEAIIAPGDTSPSGMAAKAAGVLGEMEARMSALGLSWADVTVVDVYTVEPLRDLLDAVLLARVGPAARHGLSWYVSRPPIEGLDFEMDLRGGCLEAWL